jgi:hypothetical protein
MSSPRGGQLVALTPIADTNELLTDLAGLRQTLGATHPRPATMLDTLEGLCKHELINATDGGTSSQVVTLVGFQLYLPAPRAFSLAAPCVGLVERRYRHREQVVQIAGADDHRVFGAGGSSRV